MISNKTERSIELIRKSVPYFAFLIGVAGIGIISFISLNSVGGDASIYFSYAANFWTLPFSLREGGVPMHGATGPLWVVYLSLFGSAFALLQLANLVLIILGFLILAKSDKSFLFLPILLFISSTFAYMNALIYEVSLLFVLFCVLYVTLEKHPERIKSNALLIGLLVAIRPESIILSVLLWRKDLALKDYFFSMAFVLLPFIIYLGYIGFVTGDWFPSSILERLTRHGAGEARERSGLENEILIFLKAFLQNAGKNIIYLAAVPFALLCGTRRPIFYRMAAALSLYFLIFTFSESPRWRYYLIPDILVAFTLSVCLYRLISRKTFKRSDYLLTLLSAALTLVAVFVSPAYERAAGYFQKNYLGETRTSSFEIRFAPDLDKALDEIGAETDARVLIYEFGAQFSSNREFVSLDGIIGNFPRHFDSYRAFDVAAQSNDYYVSSHGCGRVKFKGTFHKKICEFERSKEKIKVGDVVRTDLSEFEVLFVNPAEGLRAWNAIYSIKGY